MTSARDILPLTKTRDYALSHHATMSAAPSKVSAPLGPAAADFSQVNATINSTVGGIRETVGNLVGSTETSVAGKEQKASGDAEYKAAQAVGYAEGTKDRVSGKVRLPSLASCSALTCPGRQRDRLRDWRLCPGAQGQGPGRGWRCQAGGASLSLALSALTRPTGEQVRLMLLSLQLSVIRTIPPVPRKLSLAASHCLHSLLDVDSIAADHWTRQNSEIEI